VVALALVVSLPEASRRRLPRLRPSTACMDHEGNQEHIRVCPLGQEEGRRAGGHFLLDPALAASVLQLQRTDDGNRPQKEKKDHLRLQAACSSTATSQLQLVAWTFLHYVSGVWRSSTV